MSKQARVAIVTGAAGNMGLATTKFLQADGIAVGMVDLDGKRLDALSSELNASAADTKGKVFPVVCDVSDPAQVAAACAKVQAELGTIDALVNNAGILANNKVLETTPELWRKIMAVNLDSAFYFSQQVVAGMKAQRFGRIVNTCSLAAKTGGLTAGTAYAVSKGGMHSLTFSLARELAGHGITVNGIAPAYVRSPMITEQLTEAQRQKLLSEIPVGRFCEPEEFAHAVRFLVSPLSGFITGEILDMNGGLVMD